MAPKSRCLPVERIIGKMPAMTIKDRIQAAIQDYQQATGQEPVRVALSQRAYDKFIIESVPRKIGEDVDPGGEELSAFGVPIRILAGEPDEFIGVIGDSQ